MTPLVLLPGMMCDARLFSPQVATLSAARSIFLAMPDTQISIGAMAAEVIAHAPPQFALAGLSMGGIVAMEILRQAPGRVARLALMDTNPLAESDEIRARRLPQIEAVRAGRLVEVMRDEMKPNYLAGGPRRTEILNLCMEMAVDLGPEVFVRQSQALMERPDQTETLRAARQPALVLCGRQDALCPVSRHEFMADLIPGAKLEIIENAGHLPTLEQPEKTNEVLRRWLEA